MMEEEWNEWKSQPQTKEFFRSLLYFREQFKDSWSEGMYTSADPQLTQNANMKMLGMLEAISDIADLNYETYSEWI